MTQRQLVVGAIIVDSLEAPTRVLAARRSKPEALKSLWEFPGGKVELGETPRQALVREIQEELSVQVELGEEFLHTSGAWPISDVYELRLFFASIVSGSDAPGDSHDALRWLASSDLYSVDWLSSDREAIAPLIEELSRLNSRASPAKR